MARHQQCPMRTAWLTWCERVKPTIRCQQDLTAEVVSQSNRRLPRVALRFSHPIKIHANGCGHETQDGQILFHDPTRWEVVAVCLSCFYQRHRLWHNYETVKARGTEWFCVRHELADVMESLTMSQLIVAEQCLFGLLPNDLIPLITAYLGPRRTTWTLDLFWMQPFS